MQDPSLMEDTLLMDSFEPGLTEAGDLVEVFVNGDLHTTVEAVILGVTEVPGEPDKYEVGLGIVDSELNFTTYLECGDYYNIMVGQSDQELQAYLKESNSMKQLVSCNGSYSDACAKYEAYMDSDVAAMVETGIDGIHTRAHFYKKIS